MAQKVKGRITNMLQEVSNLFWYTVCHGPALVKVYAAVLKATTSLISMHIDRACD